MFIKPVNTLVLLFLFFTGAVYGQKKAAKYPSLLWEITGNGLTKPSYLFGTMHVSSKMVFHLSDSFYLALKSVDAVALELNPDQWQGQMANMDRLKDNYADFMQPVPSNYLNENSFRIPQYDDALKVAMSTEPTVVNSLLYRSYKSREDFEEDTFLDLYIYQTGKKLGKRGTGVEDYFETEKIVLQAYADMAKEKKKKTIDIDFESRSEILDKTQDAYRRGDLDLMDSLDRMMDGSDAFIEKFLYKRNEIQAGSIDTILKKSSLFVGVGAAHLPGERGVIELLRRMGYHLRPVLMTDRDGAQKEEIDRLKVPVKFTTQVAEDKFYSVDMPGPLFKLGSDYRQMDRRQYSDMSNGAYYLVTRVQTHAAFLGQTDKHVLNKVDSILYENIPGKILSKKLINRNGYSGFDISNRTRRGDLQRYNIFITPFEVIIFKISGKENYVDGEEAERFFSSIQLKEPSNGSVNFQPLHGEFTVRFPQQPAVHINTNNADKADRWEYEAVDQTTGDACLVLKKAVYNFRFLEEDDFDLGLIEESFRDPDSFDRQLYRNRGTYKGFPSLDVREKLKDGSTVYARYIIRGPHYYVVAVKSRNRKNEANAFLNSFSFSDFKYDVAKNYADTFMHFTVNTPVVPEIDNDIRAITENASEDLFNGNNSIGYLSYWPKTKNALFKSDATGELVGVNLQEYPKYFYAKDSAAFLKEELKKYVDKNSMQLYSSNEFLLKNGIRGIRFSLRDTGSSRTINRVLMLKDNYLFGLVALGDTLNSESVFLRSFFASMNPEEKKLGRDIYGSRTDEFFTDLFSKDSTTQKKAQQSISNVYFAEQDAPKIAAAIARLNLSDKEYFSSKTKLIAELGYIKDTTRPVVTDLLKKIYTQTADTSLFQNEVLKALARHQTTESYRLFKELVLQDPPVFSDNYDYRNLFRSLGDSLQLARELFPELMQLSAIRDYKDQVTGLLATLADSNIVKAADYESYFTKIYFDAKVELKKLQVKDEKILEKEMVKADTDSPVSFGDYTYGRSSNDLDDYSVLLLPFYDKKNVQLFFERLLSSREPTVRLDAAVLLLRNKLAVADSILENLAADDMYRGRLYTRLEKIKRLDRFPAKYKNQLDMARSFLVAYKSYNKPDSVVFVKKQPASCLDKKGVVYFFRYRLKKEDDWKMGISGLQPEDEARIYTDSRLTIMTEKKLKKDEPEDEQFNNQLKRRIFSQYPGGRNFFGSNNYADYHMISSYEN